MQYISEQLVFLLHQTEQNYATIHIFSRCYVVLYGHFCTVQIITDEKKTKILGGNSKNYHKSRPKIGNWDLMAS